MPKILQVFEHDRLKVDDLIFTKKHFEALVQYNEKHDHCFFEVGYQKIHFKSFVGVLQVGNLVVEILPKADRSTATEGEKTKWRNALLEMLNICKLLQINSSGDANLRMRKSSLIDLYFETFLVEAEKLLREGLKKGYRSTEGNISKLKGRLDFNQHIKRNLIHRNRFYSRYTDYDRNSFLNQVLKQCISILSIKGNEDLSSRAKAMLVDLEDIDEISVTDPSSFKRIIFGRSTERYRTAITLARLIILNFSGELRAGKENVLAILFDMNVLFEEYVLRILKKASKGDDSIQVKGQVSQVFWSAEGMKKMLRPDIVIESNRGEALERVVVDTKWKIPKDNRPHDNDLKQMYAYNLQFGAERSVLLYPKISNSFDVDGVFEGGDGPATRSHMRFVDLFDDTGRLNKSFGVGLLSRVISQIE